jgi:hypothetical protein
MEELRKTMTTLSQDSWSPEDWSPESPEYEVGALTTRPRRSVVLLFKPKYSITCVISDIIIIIIIIYDIFKLIDSK